MAWASTTMNSYASNIFCIARPIWRTRIPTKLQALYQVSQADEARLRQRTRERVVSGHGEFSRRFTPTP